MMKAIDYLEQIEKMDAKIETKMEELERLQTLAEKTTASLGGERVQASANQQKLEDCVIKIMKAQSELNASIDRFVDYKKEAMELIDHACDADSIRLLYKRYFSYMKWEEIAVDMNYTYQWISGGLHQRALSQVQKALDERGK
jgi:exonuclease VII large subunit